MKKIYLIAVIFTILFSYGCKKEGRSDFIDEKLPAPAQVSTIRVIPTPGGAMLTYRLPVDENLSYVKAVYEIQPGVFREAKSSRYTDTLKLVGFGDTLPHEVKIYSIGKNEKSSEAALVTINPNTPPVQSVFNSATLTATFGGVNVVFNNPGKADLAIVVMRDTTGNNTWATIATFYTGAVSGNFASRGLESKSQKFAMYIRDRWNNKSDTLTETLVPKFEIEIPKTTFRALVLPTDQTELASAGFVMSNLWDGISSIYASSNASTLPQWITFDMGKKVQLSRFKQFMDPGSHCYNGSGLKVFELWGSNSPDANGGWTQWILLGTFNTLKPSGLPLGQTTAEDINYATNLGADFSFEADPPPVRYLRLKTLETYSSPGQVVIKELSFWGQIIP